jgi:selenocysteine lyase/cysteine desulfurase
MTLTSQKHLFQLPEDIHYLNGAYMSPLLRSVEEAGIAGLIRKRNPSTIPTSDFFREAEEVKIKFGKLVNGAAEQVAIVPSASYGLANAIQNIPTDIGNTAIVVSNEFPSGYYAIEKWCKQHNKKLTCINAPNETAIVGATWNEQILSSITDDTCAVVISSVHWTNGTIYDLKAIGEKCQQHKALFIVDGTQSVGALAIDVAAFHIDALVCAAYKWLMGPYAIGLAYYSKAFDNGSPIEESWLNRSNAHNFTSLTQYTEDYMPGANRYSAGALGNFILLPMLNAALDQLLAWGADNTQTYCEQLTQPLTTYLSEHGFGIEDSNYRTKHLFGFTLPAHLEQAQLLKVLQTKKIFVSTRGKAIRVSTHLYNTDVDMQALIETLNLFNLKK